MMIYLPVPYVFRKLSLLSLKLELGGCRMAGREGTCHTLFSQRVLETSVVWQMGGRLDLFGMYWL